MQLRYKRRGQLLPRDVTMTRLTVFLSFGTVRQYAPATATGWVREPRPEFGQEMSYGRSLERWLKLFDLLLRFTEWATLAQDRAEWARLITRKRPH